MNNLSDRTVKNIHRAAFALELLCAVAIGLNLFDWQSEDWLWIAGWVLFAAIDVTFSMEYKARQNRPAKQWTEDQL